MPELACGIDIGGSAIKGGIVDVGAGRMLSDHVSVETPTPATPESIIEASHELLDLLRADPDIPVGISFPAPVVRGTIPFMANLDQAWVGVNIAELVGGKLGRRAVVINDADAAALGEAVFGAAKGVGGTVIVTTLGTGIGSGVVVDGVLVPNIELGHLEIDGKDAESHASARRKTVEDLSWEEWAARLQRYYSHVEMLFSPDLFVVGGAVSAAAACFLPLLRLRTSIVPAALENRAGIVGAAYAAVNAS